MNLTENEKNALQTELFAPSPSVTKSFQSVVGVVHRISTREKRSPAEVEARQNEIEAQINEIAETSPWKANPGVGYAPRVLVQATLPYREPKDAPHGWARRSGEVILSIQPGLIEDVEASMRTGKTVMKSRGYPYGTIPRLFLIWAMTHVKEHQSRTLHLGASAGDFMNAMGINAKGGEEFRRVREQLTRLFAARISAQRVRTDEKSGYVNEQYEHISITDSSDTWWRPIGSDLPHADKSFVFKSVLTLSEKFYNEIVANPVPIDLRRLRLIKGSVMAIDVYCWLTYRNFTMNDRTQFIRWETLQGMLGGGAESVPKFAQSFRNTYKKICEMGYTPKVDFKSDGLILTKSAPDVPPRLRSASSQYIEN